MRAPPAADLELRVRCARGDELPSLVLMINRAFVRESWLIPGPRIGLDELVRETARTDTKLLVAERRSEIAGVVRARTTTAIAELGLLAVEPAWQGRGIGAFLVDAVERVAAEAGCTEIELLCGQELGMVAYYEALGYRAVAAVQATHWGSTSPFTLVTMRKACSGARANRA